jgi:hypothetical protein
MTQCFMNTISDRRVMMRLLSDEDGKWGGRRAGAAGHGHMVPNVSICREHALLP